MPGSLPTTELAVPPEVPRPADIAVPERGCSASAAQAYCAQLAQAHYENFTVVSWLLPRSLRQHFYNIYAYCRWADDLADETGDADVSLSLLDWWSDELARCYAGESSHPVFIALGQTIREFGIPPQPFTDLLAAFRRDQRQTRYDTAAELLDYCRYSANPVGRLILYLGRCHDELLGALSDSICTGLQLANFCQDVARDFERGRVYLPQETWTQVGYTAEMFDARQFNERFRQGLEIEVDRAEALLVAGRQLLPKLPRHLQTDVALFQLGGLAILAAVRRSGYNVWAQRPTLSKFQKLLLLPQAWCLSGPMHR